MMGLRDRADDQRASVLAEDLRALIGKLKRRLRDQANPGDLTPSQAAVLLRLEKDGPATISNLARAERMRPQSMGAVLTPLEEAGFVRSTPDPADGRQTILSITRACREWIRKSRAARHDWLSHTIQRRLSVQEQETLALAVELLGRLVDD
jgi:DNA-binding MarR family transcriptional regulator